MTLFVKYLFSAVLGQFGVPCHNIFVFLIIIFGLTVFSPLCWDLGRQFQACPTILEPFPDKKWLFS